MLLGWFIWWNPSNFLFTVGLERDLKLPHTKESSFVCVENWTPWRPKLLCNFCVCVDVCWLHWAIHWQTTVCMNRYHSLPILTAHPKQLTRIDTLLPGCVMHMPAIHYRCSAALWYYTKRYESHFVDGGKCHQGHQLKELCINTSKHLPITSNSAVERPPFSNLPWNRTHSWHITP